MADLLRNVNWVHNSIRFSGNFDFEFPMFCQSLIRGLDESLVTSATYRLFSMQCVDFSIEMNKEI